MKPQLSLSHGCEFPYDTSDDEVFAPVTDWAHAAARGVLANLLDRSGVGNALEQCDEEVRIEIVSAVAEVIRLAHRQGNPESAQQEIAE